MMRCESTSFANACPGAAMPAALEAADILRDNIETPPRLMDLARRVGVSPPRLNREFRHHFGATVFGYLRVLRLEEARRLLESSDINITDAAFTVGYQSLPSFSRAFRDRFGVCPRQYRNRLRPRCRRSKAAAPGRQRMESPAAAGGQAFPRTPWQGEHWG
ncbi:MAG: helix-turn-helix transcriptional regulator [Desulfovibrionaceae bacterium]